MSDGLHNLAGAPGTIELNGKRYRAGKVTLGAQAEIEAHVISLQPDIVATAIKSIERLPARDRDKYGKTVIEAAIKQLDKRNAASTDQVSDFLNSFDGAAFLLWLIIREHQPEFDTPEKAGKLIEDIPLSEAQRRIDQASGLANLKNSVGPEAQGDQPTGLENEPLGQPSTVA
jgi:hypothetical protein